MATGEKYINTFPIEVTGAQLKALPSGWVLGLDSANDSELSDSAKVSNTELEVAIGLDVAKADISALKLGADTTFPSVSDMNLTNGTGQFIAGNTCITPVGTTLTLYTYEGSGATGFWGNPEVIDENSVAVSDKIVYNSNGTETTEFTQSTDIDTLNPTIISPVYQFITPIVNTGATISDITALKINVVTGTFVDLYITITSASTGVIFTTFGNFGNGVNTIVLPQTTFEASDTWTIEITRTSGTFQLKGLITGNLIWYELISSGKIENTLGIGEKGYYTDFPTQIPTSIITPTGNIKNYFYDSTNENKLSYKNSSGDVRVVEGGAYIREATFGKDSIDTCTTLASDILYDDPANDVAQTALTVMKSGTWKIDKAFFWVKDPLTQATQNVILQIVKNGVSIMTSNITIAITTDGNKVTGFETDIATGINASLNSFAQGDIIGIKIVQAAATGGSQISGNTYFELIPA